MPVSKKGIFLGFKYLFDVRSRLATSAKTGEELFFPLALADLSRAADLFQPVFARTDGVDGVATD